MTEIPQHAAAMLTAATFAGNAPDAHLLEVRWDDPASRGMGQRFFPVGNHQAATAFVIGRAHGGDAYVSALPRVRPSGTKRDVESSWVLWVDLDQDDGVDRATRLSPAPSIVIATGTPGHALVVWQLSGPLAAERVKPLNRRLAYAHGGDLSATDPARVLRVPGTLNHKHDPPRPVRCVSIDPCAYAVEEVVGSLPDPPERSRPTRAGTWAPLSADDVLATIPADVYVPALTGREVGRDGKVQCPFHGEGQERTPSLHAYSDPSAGWFCFGCERGGTIIDLGAELYGLQPRGESYREIRQRLAADLLRSAAA